MLRTYLEEKDLSDENVENIMKGLHKSIKKEEDEETKISHGTSCPRLVNKFGELLDEF